MTDRFPGVPDQPDGIPTDGSDHPAQMPELGNAVRRLIAFISSWGDGLIDVANGQPLYARDLEVITRTAQAQLPELPGELPVRLRIVDWTERVTALYGRERAEAIAGHALPEHDWRFDIDWLDGGHAGHGAGWKLDAEEVASEYLSRRPAAEKPIVNVQLPEGDVLTGTELPVAGGFVGVVYGDGVEPEREAYHHVTRALKTANELVIWGKYPDALAGYEVRIPMTRIASFTTG